MITSKEFKKLHKEKTNPAALSHNLNRSNVTKVIERAYCLLIYSKRIHFLIQ